MTIPVIRETFSITSSACLFITLSSVAFYSPTRQSHDIYNRTRPAPSPRGLRIGRDGHHSGLGFGHPRGIDESSTGEAETFHVHKPLG